MNEKKVDTLLLLIGSIILFLPSLLCIIFLVQFFPVPEPPSEQICSNLVEADLIKQEQCVYGSDYFSTIPHYFPIGTVNSDYVMAGMKTFELVSYGGSATCDEGGEFTHLTYLITIDTVYFYFCDDLLVDIQYEDE